MKKQLQIKTEDSKDKRGKVAILTEQTLPLTVIDDFIVRALGKKGVLGKNINRNKIQFIAENSNSSSSPSIVYGLMSSISSPSSSCPSLSLSSCLSRPLIEKGPNEGNYPDSLELIELNEPLNSSTPALTNSSTHEPLNLPTPALTNSSIPDFSPDPIYQTTSSLPLNEIVYYYHHDHLGNIRAVTDQNGNVVERHDFYPFGEEITQPTNKDSYLFTGKPRDSETGLDYFGARYYSSFFSRFLSVDPGKSNPRIPQTWNKYTYCLNNSIKYIDPTGKYFIIPYNDKNRNQILRALALGALTPSGSKVFWKIQRDSRPVVIKSGNLPVKYMFDSSGRPYIHTAIGGVTKEISIKGQICSINITLSFANIKFHSKDQSGLITTYHELMHTNSFLEKGYPDGRVESGKQDKTGEAEKFGEQVFMEYFNLSETIEPAKLEAMIQSVVDEIEKTQLENIKNIINIIWNLADAIRSYAFGDVEWRLERRAGGNQ